MIDKIFFALSALIWLPYGLYCFVDPGFLSGAAGVTSTSVTGSVELRAMYGGLQAGIGVMMVIAMRRAAVRPAAYIALAFLAGGLGGARLAAAVAEGDGSSYTIAALVFEWAIVAFSLWRLRAPELAVAARTPA